VWRACIIGYHNEFTPLVSIFPVSLYREEPSRGLFLYNKFGFYLGGSGTVFKCTYIDFRLPAAGFPRLYSLVASSEHRYILEKC